MTFPFRKQDAARGRQRVTTDLRRWEGIGRGLRPREGQQAARRDRAGASEAAVSDKKVRCAAHAARTKVSSMTRDSERAR